MNKFLLFPFLFFSISLFAQPVNDDCGGIIDLGTAPFCPNNTIYNNVGATMSEIGNDNIPFCWIGNPDRDVWFSFVASDTILEFTISVIGTTDNTNGIPAMINPEVAIYRGNLCGFDELALLDCASTLDTPGETDIEFNPPALTPGITYFLRVSDWSATAVPNSGAFRICVQDQVPVVTIDQTGSDACSGEIFDSGGANNNYQNNENHVFTICPKDEHICLNFDLEFFNVQVESDRIFFFDGPDTDAPLIQEFGADNFYEITGVSGGGSVCHSLQATSGCLTIQFISDGAGNSSGFKGFWECSTEPCEELDILEVESEISDQTIVDNITDPQMTVTIDTIICESTQFGVFNGDDTDLGLGEGLLLTTGNVLNAIGPNDGPNQFLENLGNPGDDDLDVLSPFNLSNDACVVELDVFVPTDELTFEYIFASEEYAEFVNDNFNDIFAFLVSGPGITGDPALNNQENIALLPGTNTPVEIDAVNNLVNWEYYHSNETSDFNPFDQNGQSLEYDAYTTDFLGIKKSLTARKKVTPCQTYHLKLAIADRGDNSYDSGVFVSQISGGTPTLLANFFSGIDYLVEDCTVVPDEVIISIPLPETEAVTYNVTVAGSATQGVDYNLSIPSTITFQPGETQFKFPIQPISDMQDEGTETIEISLSRDFGCGSFTYSTLIIELQDKLSINIETGVDTAYLCPGGDIRLNVTGANQYIWTPSPIFDDNQDNNPLTTPTVSQMVFVEGSLGICQADDSIWLEITDPVLEIAALGDTTICEGNSVGLTAFNNVNNTELSWTPNIDIDDDEAQTVLVDPEISTTYIATVELNGCSALDSIFIDVDPFDFPVITTLDTTICQNQSFQLAESIGNSTTTFVWTPATGLNNSMLSGPVAEPVVNTVYTLIATSESAFCADTVLVDVEVLPINIEIISGDSTFICLGENVVLNSETTTGGVGQTWTPTNDLVLIDNETVDVSPTISTVYTSTLVVGGCTHQDSIIVMVDSLPSMPIIKIPNRASYCLGDTVSLISSSFIPSNFPNMQFQWSPATGATTATTNPNLIITAEEDLIYTRTMVNRSCNGDEMIEINIAQDFVLTADGDQDICPGEEVMLAASADLSEISFVWNEAGNQVGTGGDFSAVPLVTTVYEVVATDPSDCYERSEEINVVVTPTFSLNNFNLLDENGNVLNLSEVVKGQSISLSVQANSSLNGATYIWFQDGAMIQTTNSPQTAPFIVADFEGEKAIAFEVLVFDEGGCLARAFIEATFIDDATVSIPNIFSPDDDGINDRFKIITNGISQINLETFQVFNRWGQLVYDNENDFEGWDGNQNGEPAPSDVYVYKIIYSVIGTGVETVLNGELTLIR